MYKNLDIQKVEKNTIKTLSGMNYSTEQKKIIINTIHRYLSTQDNVKDINYMNYMLTIISKFTITLSKGCAEFLFLSVDEVEKINKINKKIEEYKNVYADINKIELCNDIQKIVDTTNYGSFDKDNIKSQICDFLKV